MRGPELRLFLRPVASDPVRRRGRTRIQHGRLRAVHSAGLPHATLLAGRWPLPVRRAGRRLYAAARRPQLGHRAAGSRSPGARYAIAGAGYWCGVTSSQLVRPHAGVVAAGPTRCLARECVAGGTVGWDGQGARRCERPLGTLSALNAPPIPATVSRGTWCPMLPAAQALLQHSSLCEIFAT